MQERICSAVFHMVFMWSKHPLNFSCNKKIRHVWMYGAVSLFGWPDSPVPPLLFPFIIYLFFQYLFSFVMSQPLWDLCTPDTNHTCTLWDSFHWKFFNVLLVKLKWLYEVSCWLLVSLLGTVIYSSINRKQCIVKKLYASNFSSVVLLNPTCWKKQNSLLLAG